MNDRVLPKAEPADQALTRAGELFYFPHTQEAKDAAAPELLEIRTFRMIPGHDYKMMADYGNPFNHAETKYTAQTTVLELQKIGILNESGELVTDPEPLITYEMPISNTQMTFIILDTMIDLTGWCRVVVGIQYPEEVVE